MPPLNVSHRTLRLLGLAGILLATFFAFRPGLSTGFSNWDDPEYLLTNLTVRKLSAPNIHAMWSSTTGGSYLPLTLMSFAAEYHQIHYQPFYYHLTNLLIHLADVALVFWLITLLTPSRLIAFLATLLFAIHPLRVESVTWVVGRKDVLYALFYLAACVSYLDGLRGHAVRGRILSLLFFTLSCLSKPQAVTLPLSLLALDYVAGKKITFRSVMDKLPFFLLSIFFFALVFATAAPMTEKDRILEHFSIIEKCLMSCLAFLTYIGKSLVPIKLSCFYPYPEKTHGILPWIVYTAPVCAAALAVLIWRIGRSERLMTGGALLFLSMIFLPIGNIWLDGDWFSDRYSYLASIGIALMVAVLVRNIFMRSRLTGRTALILGLILYSFWLGFGTSQRCKVWKNGITLWSDVIAKYPRAFIAYNNRGNLYDTLGKTGPALDDYNRALAIKPDYYRLYNNRGVLYKTTKRYDLALADYNKTVNLKSDFLPVYINRGNLYLETGRTDLAIADYQRAIDLNPEEPRIYRERARAYFQQGDIAKTLADYAKILSINPDDALTYFNQSIVYVSLRDFKKALAAAEKAKSLGLRISENYLTELNRAANR